jgi:hypothetical protein
MFRRRRISDGIVIWPFEVTLAISILTPSFSCIPCFYYTQLFIEKAGKLFKLDNQKEETDVKSICAGAVRCRNGREKETDLSWIQPVSSQAGRIFRFGLSFPAPGAQATKPAARIAAAGAIVATRLRFLRFK